MVRLTRTLAPALLAALTLGGCTFHEVATEMNGVDGIRGVPVDYQITTSWALHGLFVLPILGDGNKSAVLDEFTKEAAARGASRHRVVKTWSLTYWFILPPISFFIHPVQTSIEGDVELQ